MAVMNVAAGDERLLFRVRGLPVHALGEEDAPQLQRLFERCDDYFDLIEGRPAPADAALAELRDGPPERAPHDLISLGITGWDGELAGFIGTLRHHREPDQWYLGLLLLDPAWRGRGLGSIAYWTFQQWIAGQGATSLLLAAAESNQRAHRFWQSLGFGQPRAYPARQMGLKRHVLIEYEKRVTA